MTKRKRYYKAKNFGGSGAGESNVTTGWRWAKRVEGDGLKAAQGRGTSELDKAVERFILALIASGILFAIFK